MVKNEIIKITRIRILTKIIIYLILLTYLSNSKLSILISLKNHKTKTQTKLKIKHINKLKVIHIIYNNDYRI